MKPPYSINVADSAKSAEERCIMRGQFGLDWLQHLSHSHFINLEYERIWESRIFEFKFIGSRVIDLPFVFAEASDYILRSS